MRIQSEFVETSQQQEYKAEVVPVLLSHAKVVTSDTVLPFLHRLLDDIGRDFPSRCFDSGCSSFFLPVHPCGDDEVTLPLWDNATQKNNKLFSDCRASIKLEGR